MAKILFENKKVALGFAGAIVVGAALISEMSGGPDASADTADRAFGESVEVTPGKNDEESGAEGEKKIAFADDDDLIDDASGFDTAPDGSDDSDNGELEEGDGEAADERDVESREDRRRDREGRGDRRRDRDEFDDGGRYDDFDEDDPYAIEGF